MNAVLNERCGTVCTPEQKAQCFLDVAQKAGELALGQINQIGEAVTEKRDYQIEAWKAIDDTRQQGKNSALVHLAPGLGKTTIGVIDALRYIDKFTAEGTVCAEDRQPRILFVCHKNEILDQAAERFAQFAPGLKQGRFSEGQKDLESPVVFASMKSLYLNLANIDPEQFDYIIYDEAHHAQADTFKKVVEHFKPGFQLALTGTPDRMDRKDIREMFGEPVYSKSMAEGMSEGYLADVDYHIVFDDAVKRAMESGFDPSTLKEIKDLLKNESRNEEIARQIKTKMEEIGLRDAKTIVFCDTIDQADEMALLLTGEPYHSKVIDTDVRKETLQKFRDNRLQIITSRDMLGEGVDIPDARLLIFLRSTGSKALFEQFLGRGLRKYAGKDIVSVLDFVASIERLALIKQLSADVAEARRRVAKSKGDVVISDTPIGGLSIHTDHADFNFDKISVSLLDKIYAMQRGEQKDWSAIEDINDAAALWQERFGATKPSDEIINEASLNGSFISTTRLRKMGGLGELKRVLGYDVIDYEEIKSVEDLAALWRDKFPDTKPSKKLIRDASKAGHFVSANIVSKHGGISALAKSLGFETIDYAKIDSMEAVAALWQERFPGVRPTKKSIVAAARAGRFISEVTVLKYGGIDDLRDKLNFERPQKIETLAQLASLWASRFPGVMPTVPVIRTASSDGLFVSNSHVKKFGGVKALRDELGYERVERIDPKEISSIDDLAEIWNQRFPGIEPSKDRVREASVQNLFVTNQVTRDFGGIIALKAAVRKLNET